MGEMMEKMGSAYAYLIDDLADGRTKDLPLISSPLAIVIIVTTYLSFCLSIGPYLMKNRKPFQLKTTIQYYNVFQILLSIFLAYEGGLYVLSKDYNVVCDPVTQSYDARVYRAARSSWWYFFAKNTELIETVFFVLRKKYKQVSTLHLYHHTMVIITSWLSTKYFPVGPIVLVGALNSAVHVLMYTYYFLAALGPQYQKYLWWKKHITLIQLVQFVIIIAHNTNGLFNNCNYPKMVHIFLIGNTGMLFYMFSKFYYNNYIKSKSKKREEGNGKTKVKGTLQTKRKSISVGQ